MRRSAILWTIAGGALILAGCGDSQGTAADSGTGMSSGSGSQGAGADSGAGISSGSSSQGGSASRDGSAKGDDIDQVMQDLLSVLKESSDLLAAIKDEQSARAAARQMVEDTVLLGLKHSNPDVVRACCNILGAVGTSKSIPELRRKLRHRNDVIARAAKDARQAITARRERDR